MIYNIIFCNELPVYVFVGDYQKAKIKISELADADFKLKNQLTGMANSEYWEKYHWYIQMAIGEIS